MKYDLGSKSSGPGCCAPSPCCDSESKTYYPSLYISGDGKIDLPDEGTAVITFRKVDAGEDTRDPDKPRYRCELEVHSIEPKGAAKSDGMVSVGEALKDGLRKKLKKGNYSEESE